MGKLFNYNHSELDEFIDIIKVAVLKDLIAEDILSYEDAEDYSANHALIIKKKTLFRTISSLWANQEEYDGYFIVPIKIASDFRSLAIESKEEKKEPKVDGYVPNKVVKMDIPPPKKP